MSFTPLASFIVIRKPVVQETTSAGIFLPDEVRPDAPSEGEVVAVGEKTSMLKIGDRVIYKRFAPLPITIEGVDYLIAQESDVLIKLT